MKVRKENKKHLDYARALFITNLTIENYIFGQREAIKYPNNECIKNVYVGYSNLICMLPTHYHGWKAFFKQIRFDLRFLDGLQTEHEKFLYKEIKSLQRQINAFLGLPKIK